MNALEEFSALMEKLRTASFRGFEGYRVDKILTIPTQEVLKGAFGMSRSLFFKTILSSVLKDGYHYDFGSIKDANIVLFYSHDHARRKDYVQFMETVSSCYDGAALFTGQTNNGGIKISLLSVKMLFLLFLWLVSLRQAGISKKYWRKYLSSLVYSYKWKCMLMNNQNVLLSIKGMVSIFDAREFENVLTQFLNSHNIPTATLQHGHYGNEYYSDPQHFYIGIGYRGFVSNYFLLWGESSYRNAIACGIPKEQLIKVGSPDLIKSHIITGRTGKIGVLLDGGKEAIADNKYMYRLVRSLAQKLDKSMLIKLHPSYKTSEYTFFLGDDNVEIYDDDLESFAAETEMAVCCNTSCLITLLIWGHPLMHYAPVSMYDMYSELRGYSFSNEEEMNDLYEKTVSPLQLLSLYTESGDVKENYMKAFEMMITKNKK